MNTDAPKPRYRIEYLTFNELQEKFDLKVKSYYWLINQESNRYQFISQIS